MASIKRTNIADESLTILTVSGIFTAEKVIRAFEKFIEHNVTANLLWDFSDADLSQITQKNMEKIIAFTKSKAHLRKNGRTAFVSEQDLPFGVSRMYQTLSEINEHPISQCVFRDMDKALTWIKTGK